MTDSIVTGGGQQPDLSKMMPDKEAAERIRVIVTEAGEGFGKSAEEAEEARVEGRFQIRLLIYGLIEDWGYAETAKEWRKTW